MNKARIAVAMSVYNKDKASFLELAIESLYQQSNPNFDIYLQVDGPISNRLISVLEDYNKKENFFLDYYPKNMGLAFQLNRAFEKIITSGKYSYIARMDADDICMPNRFEEQTKFLFNTPHIAVLGCSVIEFEQDGVEFEKAMPLCHLFLAKNIIRRCPFNHPTVMFNLNVIDNNDMKYDVNLKNTQDYYLWVDLLKRGYKFANLDQALLKFRIDENFHSRRGLKKSLNDLNSRIYAMRELKIVTLTNVLHTLFLFILRLSPVFIKKFAYKKLR